MFRLLRKLWSDVEIGWKAWLIIFIGLAIALNIISWSGCQSVQTPEGKKYYRISPVVHEQVEETLEAGATLSGALAPIVPYAGPIAGLLAGALAVWRKDKKKITAVENTTQKMRAGAKVLSDFIDYIKINEPETWDVIREYLDVKLSKDDDARSAVNEIRGK